MQNTRSTFSILFYINTSKTKKSGKCPILGRISIDGENKAFSTGLDILPTDWDAGLGIATGKFKDNLAINGQIENYKAEVEKYYRSMLENKGFVTAEMLKNALRGIGINQNTVMQEFSNFLEEKRKSIGIKISENTYIQYCNGYEHFKDFLKEKLGVEDIPFGKVDIAFIEDYVYYLKIDLRMAANSVMSFLIPFRTTVRRAFNKGLLRQYPFFDYTREKVIARHRWLSKEEIVRLMKVEMSHRSKWIFIRDMFLFSVFTGLSYIDLKNLKQCNIQQQKDGSMWIVLNRQKTGTASYIPLLPVAQKILEKYQDARSVGKDGKVFKLLTLEAINIRLKTLAEAAKIDKCLTFHVARHSNYSFPLKTSKLQEQIS
jgi:site-specific recombinase XerD